MRNLFVRICVLAAAVIFGIFAQSSFAEISWYESGVIGEKLVGGDYEYTEITFVTGEPVVLRGTMKKDQKASDIFTAKGNSFKQSYDYNLSSDDGTVVLNRQVTFDVRFVRDEELGQIRTERSLTRFSESFLTPAGQFTLGKYNYVDSRVTDLTPALAYSSGNAVLERTFYLNGDFRKNAGVLTIKTEVRPFVAYRNRYSENESVKAVHHYRFVAADGSGGSSGGSSGSSAGGSGSSGSSSGDASEKGFGGTVETNLSSLEKTIFDYQYTDPQNISFRGSFFQYRIRENVTEVRYDFLKDGKRKGSVERLHARVTTDSKPLNIPTIRDMGGMPTERQVALLMALNILDPSRVYFVPHATISRNDFAKAVLTAVRGKLPEPSKNDLMKRRRAGVETPFLDIPVDHPDYHYVEEYKKQGLIKGKNRYFKPNEPITKAEALVILMRTTGLDKVAPNPPYRTVFADDAQIPEWCKDVYYMALEIGLIGGEDTGGFVVRTDRGLYASPKSCLTKEQAAVLIERLIRHLNERLIPDYREKILKK